MDVAPCWPRGLRPGFDGMAKEAGDLGGHDLKEEARPLMNTDEIRRTDFAINIVRRHRPFLSECTAFAEIAPWRRLVGINPFHNKRFLKPIKLRLGSLFSRINPWS